MKSIEFSPLAETDLEKIWLYTVDQWSLHQANMYLNKLQTIVENIAGEKIFGRAVDYIRKGYFYYKMDRHLIFYKVSKTSIIIIRILHEKMDLTKHFDYD